MRRLSGERWPDARMSAHEQSIPDELVAATDDRRTMTAFVLTMSSFVETQ
jgi:hypothetical protein